MNKNNQNKYDARFRPRTYLDPFEQNGEVKIIKPADPEKIYQYHAKRQKDSLKNETERLKRKLAAKKQSDSDPSSGRRGRRF